MFSEECTCEKRVCCWQNATNPLVLGNLTPCAKQLCTSRSARQHLAQNNSRTSFARGCIALCTRAAQPKRSRCASWKRTQKKCSRFFFPTLPRSPIFHFSSVNPLIAKAVADICTAFLGPPQTMSICRFICCVRLEVNRGIDCVLPCFD